MSTSTSTTSNSNSERRSTDQQQQQQQHGQGNVTTTTTTTTGQHPERIEEEEQDQEQQEYDEEKGQREHEENRDGHDDNVESINSPDEKNGGSASRNSNGNRYSYKAPPVPPTVSSVSGRTSYGSSNRLYSRQSHTGTTIKPRVETSLGKKVESENTKPEENEQKFSNDRGSVSKTGPSNNIRKVEPSYQPSAILNPLQMALDQTFAGIGSGGGGGIGVGVGVGSSGTSSSSGGINHPGSPGSPLVETSRQNFGKRENISISSLNHCGIESLLAQMKLGTECLKSFSHAIKAFSKEQIRQYDETIKLLRKSKQDYGALESMPNFTFAMELVHQMIEETLENQKEYAQFLEVSVLSIVANLEKSCESEYDTICNRKKTADKSLRKAKNEAAKLRKETSDAAEHVIKSRQKSSEKEADPANRGTLMQLLGKHKGTQDKNKMSQDSDYMKTKNIEKQFQVAVGKYNAELRTYNEEYEAWKQEIVNTEHLRLESMKTLFHQLVTKQKQLQNDKKLSVLHHDIIGTVDKMNSKQELEKFVNFCVERHGRHMPTEEQKTSLDLEYRDVFLSIEDAMAVTREMDANATIPYIVPMLCGKVKELNGFHTEGIFRKSANIADVKKLRNKLRMKNFDFDEQNVHIFASCLKEWLRSLEDPLIPELYYDFCVDMAKKGKLDKGQFEVFFSQLPAVNRETLKYLVKFLRELIDPQYVKTTLMGIDNLAIIFGPTLLRTETLDPTTALANSQSEKEFVIALIDKA